jgi:hypothetical protein
MNLFPKDDEASELFQSCPKEWRETDGYLPPIPKPRCALSILWQYNCPKFLFQIAYEMFTIPLWDQQQQKVSTTRWT